MMAPAGAPGCRSCGEPFDTGGFQAQRNIVLWPYTRLDDPRLVLADGDPRGADRPPGAPRASTHPSRSARACRRGWVAHWRDGLLLVKRAAHDEDGVYADMGASAQVYAQPTNHRARDARAARRPRAGGGDGPSRGLGGPPRRRGRRRAARESATSSTSQRRERGGSAPSSWASTSRRRRRRPSSSVRPAARRGRRVRVRLRAPRSRSGASRSPSSGGRPRARRSRRSSRRPGSRARTSPPSALSGQMHGLDAPRRGRGGPSVPRSSGTTSAPRPSATSIRALVGRERLIAITGNDAAHRLHGAQDALGPRARARGLGASAPHPAAEGPRPASASPACTRPTVPMAPARSSSTSPRATGRTRSSTPSGSTRRCCRGRSRGPT